MSDTRIPPTEPGAALLRAGKYFRLYRSRDPKQLGARPARRGWEKTDA